MAIQAGSLPAEPLPDAVALRVRIAQLEAQLATLEDVLAYQTEWICRFRPDGTLTYVNHAYARDLQTAPEQLLGRTFFDFIPPDERPGVSAHLAALGPEQPVVSYEHRVQLPDGRVRWDQWTDHAVFDAQGHVIEIQSFGRDITARKLAQKQLTAQRDLAQALAATSSLEVALPICLDIALRVAQFDCGGFYLVDPATGDLTLVFARNLSEGFLSRTSHWLADSDRVRLVMQGQPCYTPYASVTTQASDFHEGLSAVVMLPLSYQGQVIGCLNLGSHVYDEVPLDVRNALEAIAAQVGQAIIRIQTEASLRVGQQSWQALFDSLQDFLFVLAQDGTMLRVNQLVIQRLGYREEELLGQPVLMVHPPELHAEALTIIADMMAGRRAVCPLSLMTKSGERFPVETKVIRGRWGNQEVLFGVSRDVSEHLRIESALHASEARLRALVHHFPNGAILLFDHELRYLVADGHDLGSHGLNSAMVEGRTLWEVFPLEVAAQIEPICRAALAGRSPTEVEISIGASWYQLYGVPIHNEAGVPSAGLLLVLNISEQKRTQTLLSEQTDAMVTLRERERVAHELHDSLGQVLAYINVHAQSIRDTITSGRLAKADAALASLIAVAQESQIEVRDVILAARAQRPAHAPAPDLDSFIPALHRYVQWMAQVHNLHTELTISAEVGTAAITPSVGAQQLRIVQEALTNVRRHAGVQRAEVTVWVEGERLMVLVSDQGCGFDLTSPSRATAGVGLQTMRERAEEIGGTLTLTTTPGQGTAVKLAVPLRPTSDQEPTELRVLLVDANPLFLQALWQLLQRRGFAVVGAVGDGPTAVEWARALRPDVVLMNVTLPTMSGITAMRTILADLPWVHVAMLTVAEDEATLFAAIKAGAAGYLLKSMDATDLCEQIQGFARGETTLSTELAQRVLHELAAHPTGEPPAPTNLALTLTPQQVQVLTLLAQGYTYPAIGQLLGYSERAIKYHTGDAMKKLQLHSRANALTL